MRLAIDVGNTHTVYAVHDGESWRARWRRATSPDDTSDVVAVWLRGVFELSGLPFRVDGASCVSVVPFLDVVLDHLCERYLNVRLLFLRSEDDHGFPIDYDPPTSLGADRICNCLGALAKYAPPILVIDFGTATKFDAVDASGQFVGGAIMPGLRVSSQALAEHAPRLPVVGLRPPKQAIGKNTKDALQSGIMLGYAGAVDTLARKILEELGGGLVVATGGLGSLFLGVCETFDTYEPMLTLDGLLAYHLR